MQPYQEEYIVNLKSLSALTLHNRQRSQTFEEYLENLSQNQQKAEQIVKRNMEKKKKKLFPILDHIFDASKEELQDLQEFAEKLSNGKEELDNGLFYQIHKALLCFSRLTKDRIGMIRELYWQGMNYYYIYKKLLGLDSEETKTYSSQMRLALLKQQLT